MLLWATLATSSSQAMTRSRWKKIVTSFYRSLLFFWHHSENWVFLKTVSFHFQSIKWALTLQWCKTLAWKDLSHVQSRRTLFEWKWLLIALRGFIDRFWQNNFLQNRDMACKLGCGLFLSPQLDKFFFAIALVWLDLLQTRSFRESSFNMTRWGRGGGWRY